MKLKLPAAKFSWCEIVPPQIYPEENQKIPAFFVVSTTAVAFNPPSPWLSFFARFAGVGNSRAAGFRGDRDACLRGRGGNILQYWVSARFSCLAFSLRSLWQKWCSGSILRQYNSTGVLALVGIITCCCYTKTKKKKKTRRYLVPQAMFPRNTNITCIRRSGNEPWVASCTSKSLPYACLKAAPTREIIV